jgi:hypothetical protein
MFYTCDQGSGPQLFKHGTNDEHYTFHIDKAYLNRRSPGPQLRQRPEPGLSYITPVPVVIPT